MEINELSARKESYCSWRYGVLERPAEDEHVISDLLSCSHVGQVGGGDRRILESAQVCEPGTQQEEKAKRPCLRQGETPESFHCALMPPGTP